MTLSCALLTFFITVISNTKAEILLQPQNTTVFANQLAEFTCIVRGPNVFLGVNQTYYTALPDHVQLDSNLTTTRINDTTTEFKLTIRAKPDYNGTVIECTSEYLDRTPVLSDAAVLLIQGIPSAVGNLTAGYNTTSITLFWTTPFSLDVTGVDPDIWHSISIYNMTDKNNARHIPCTECTSINYSQYTFTPHNYSPSQVYAFSVATVNGVGQSIGTNITVRVPIFTKMSVKAACDEVDITFNVQGGEGYYTHFILHGVPQKYTRSPFSAGNKVTYTLPQDTNYSAFFEVFTTTGSINTSVFTLSTYSLQTILIEEENDELRMKGEFIVNSVAVGCLVVLQGSSFSSPDTFISLLKTNMTNLWLPSDTYTIYGYDLDKDWVPKTSPSVVKNQKLHRHAGKTPRKSSIVLVKGNISLDENEVIVDCEFQKDFDPQNSCVLIYRQYDSPSLSVLELPSIINFPVTVAVENSQNYSFALFGKNSVLGIEKEPVIIATFRDEGKEAEDKNEEEEEESKVIVIITSLGTLSLVACLAVVVILLLVFMLARHRWRQQAVDQAERNGGLYEEIDVQSTSPAITMDSNAAYITHTSNVAVTNNAAYASHIII